jgi:hypothetical protein
MARTSYISIRWWWCPLCTRQTRLVGFYSASSLKQQSLHSDTLSWVPSHTSLLLFLKDTCLVEKQTYRFNSILFHPTGLFPMIYCACTPTGLFPMIYWACTPTGLFPMIYCACTLTGLFPMIYCACTPTGLFPMIYSACTPTGLFPMIYCACTPNGLFPMIYCARTLTFTPLMLLRFSLTCIHKLKQTDILPWKIQNCTFQEC